MRDKLIDIILTAQGFKETGTIAEGYEAVFAAEVAARKAAAGKIADALLAAGVVATDNNDGCKWVSVEERLPKRDEYVWCYSNKNGGHFFMGYRGWYSGEWMEGGSCHIGEVTHWMPLLAPPKEE